MASKSPTSKARGANLIRQRQFRDRIRESKGEFLSVVLDKQTAVNLRKVCKATGYSKRNAIAHALQIATLQ